MATKVWIYEQSAVIPYRDNGNGLEVLLITSRRSGRWIVPKGIVEFGMNAAQSAAKEALEEAGVEGDVSEKALGKYEYDKWGGTCRVKVFALRVTAEHEEWDESAFRRREWVSPEAAARRVQERKLKKMLLDFSDGLHSNGNQQ